MRRKFFKSGTSPRSTPGQRVGWNADQIREVPEAEVLLPSPGTKNGPQVGDLWMRPRLINHVSPSSLRFRRLRWTAPLRRRRRARRHLGEGATRRPRTACPFHPDLIVEKPLRCPRPVESTINIEEFHSSSRWRQREPSPKRCGIVSPGRDSSTGLIARSGITVPHGARCGRYTRD